MPCNPPTIQCILDKIRLEIVNPIISILFAVATLVFFWGLITYVIGSQGDETKIKKGKAVMGWGLVGLTIMASAWGIVKAFCQFFSTCQ